MKKIISTLSDADVICRHCFSKNYYKKGFVCNKQRYYCKSCKRTFTASSGGYDDLTKLFAVHLYLNNCGIRKVAKILNVSPPTILRWLRWAHKKFIDKLEPLVGTDLDVIELDEIYTFIKKKRIEFPFGLLILEDRSVLLHLK